MYPKKMEPKTTSSEFSGSITTTARRKRTLRPIVLIVLRANGKELLVYGLIDTGSEITAMKAKTAARLGLQNRSERDAIRTIDGQKKPMDREVVNFSIASLYGCYSFNIVDPNVMETFEL